MVTKNERYLPDAQLLAMRRERMTLHEIAEANYEATGFRPGRADLSSKLAALDPAAAAAPIHEVAPIHKTAPR